MTDIDTTDLENEVIEHWEHIGYQHLTETHISFPLLPPGGMVEHTLTPQAEAILDDINAMIAELGHDSIASYIISKQNRRAL